MSKASIIAIVLLVIVAAGGWYNWYKLYRKPAEVITVIERHTDTVKIKIEKPVYTNLVCYKFFDFPVESVVYKDSLVQVQVPIEEKTFTDDSTYTATVSGFHPNLESIEIYQHNTTITQTQTQVIYKKPIITLGVGASAVWNPVNHNFDWGIAVGVYIPLWNWYI